MTKFNRRNFLASASCGAYVAGLAASAPAMTRQVFAIQDDKDVVAKKDWGHIEKLTDNCWAVVSTPFDKQDFTTVCNGGILAGKDRVVVIEAYMQPNGAGWVAEWAKKLTGRWPTDIIVTHFHADHSGGANAFFKEKESPNLWVTKPTHDNIQRELKAKNAKLEEDERTSYPKIRGLANDKSTTLDLGGSKIKLTPRKGHTSSDITVEMVDPNIIFCGDLFFNRMIPNYKDAFAANLNREIDSLKREKDSWYIPGHGPVAGNDDLKLYREFLGFVEESAATFFKKGMTAEEAAKEFKLSKTFADWYIFSPAVVPRAMAAWYREFENE